MSAEQQSLSFGEIQGKMQEVEKSQEKLLGAQAEQIFDEAAFINKVQAKQKTLSSVLKNASLSKAKQEEILRSPEMQKVMTALNRMKTLQSDKESLRKMGESITNQLLVLYDKHTPKISEKKEAAADPEIQKAVELAYKSDLPALSQKDIQQLKASEVSTASHFRNEIKNYTNAANVWYKRQLPTFLKNGITADESGNDVLQQKTVLQGAYQEIRKTSDYYKRYDAFLKTHSNAYIKGKIGQIRDNLRTLLKQSPANKEKISLSVNQLNQALSFYREISSTPSKRIAYQKDWAEKMGYKDLPKSLGNDAMPRLLEVSLGVGKGMGEAVAGSAKFVLDLAQLPVLAMYIKTLPKDQKGLAQKVLAENNTVAGLANVAGTLGRSFSEDPVGMSKQLGHAIEFAYREKGSWWETLPNEEKGKIMGIVIASAIPALNVKTADGIKGIGALMKVAGKYKIDIGPVLSGKIKWPQVIGPETLQNKVFSKLKQNHPEKYNDFFDKNKLLNREFFDSKEGQLMLKDAGFNYMAMGDIGGLGSINKIFGKDAGDETIAALKTLQNKYKDKGLLVIKASDGDEVLFFSFNKKTMNKARKEYKKIVEKDVYMKETLLKRTLIKDAEKMKKSIKSVEEGISKHLEQKLGKDFKVLDTLKVPDQITLLVKEINTYMEKLPSSKPNFSDIIEQSLVQIKKLKAKPKLSDKEKKSLALLEYREKHFSFLRDDYMNDAQKMSKEVQGRLSPDEVYKYLQGKYLSSMHESGRLSKSATSDGDLYMVSSRIGKNTDVVEMKSALDQGVSDTKGKGKQIGTIKPQKLAYKETSGVKQETARIATLKQTLAVERNFDELPNVSLMRTLDELGFEKGVPVALTSWEFNLGAINNMTGKVLGMSGTELGDMVLLTHKVKVNEILKLHPGLDAKLVQNGGSFSLLLQPRTNFTGSVTKIQDEILSKIAVHHQELLSNYISGKSLVDYLSRIQAKTIPVSVTSGAGKNTFIELQSVGKRDILMNSPQFKNKTLSYIIDTSKKITTPLEQKILHK
ncbi:MAG: hypothetical protein ACK4NC_03910 [Candidatus Gracilibacteria bacterium]